MTVRKDQYNEWRVCPRGANEERAYYTDDLDDAVATARAIAEEQKGSDKCCQNFVTCNGCEYCSK